MTTSVYLFVRLVHVEFVQRMTALGQRTALAARVVFVLVTITIVLMALAHCI